MLGLRQRGRFVHESGAFLLGAAVASPASLSTTTSIRMPRHRHRAPQWRYFDKLWDLGRLHGLTVVADVHTHPRG
jgi:hypothetical protein